MHKVELVRLCENVPAALESSRLPFKLVPPLADAAVIFSFDLTGRFLRRNRSHFWVAYQFAGQTVFIGTIHRQPFYSGPIRPSAHLGHFRRRGKS